MKRPNIFVVAFVVGAAVLTLLPFLQRRFLNAPAPVMTLPSWSLATSTGEVVSSEALRGRVWMATFVSSPCDAECLARQDAFGRSLSHLDDLDGGVVLVTFSLEAPGPSVPGWYVLGSAGEVIDGFRAGWATWAGTDAGTSAGEFARLPGVAVVDQNGALRGFWKDDAAGRGNGINAARLLLRHGASPGK